MLEGQMICTRKQLVWAVGSGSACFNWLGNTKNHYPLTQLNSLQECLALVIIVCLEGKVLQEAWSDGCHRINAGWNKGCCDILQTDASFPLECKGSKCNRYLGLFRGLLWSHCGLPLLSAACKNSMWEGEKQLSGSSGGARLLRG